jgi:DNA-binding MarR family transcriptional regulator
MSSDPTAAFVLDAFLPYRLSVVSNRVSRLFARQYSERFGLSIAEWRVLAVLGTDGVATASAVRERTGMDKAKISRAVAALLARGLLAHAARGEDRRLAPLVLTAAGQAIHAAIVPLARQIEAEITADLPPGDLALLRRALAAIEARAAAAGPGAGDALD